jgi:hypothetical protein
VRADIDKLSDAAEQHQRPALINLEGGAPQVYVDAVAKVERSHDNKRSQSKPAVSSEQTSCQARSASAEHMRCIQPMTREQQIALIEEARAARRVEQEAAEAADARALMMALDQERTYGKGLG